MLIKFFQLRCICLQTKVHRVGCAFNCQLLFAKYAPILIVSSGVMMDVSAELLVAVFSAYFATARYY